MIEAVYPFGPVETNAVLLACEKTRQAVLFDCPQGCCNFLRNHLDRKRLTLTRILLTHSHWDHIADAALCKRTFGVPLAVHCDDAPNLRTPGADHLPMLFPVEGIEPDELFEEGAKFTVGELEMEVLHTPGHSPGSVCFYLPREKLLVSGDTLFCGTCGNTSFPTSMPQKMGSSLMRLAALPKEVRVLPGHGEATTIGAESWIVSNKYF